MQSVKFLISLCHSMVTSKRQAHMCMCVCMCVMHVHLCAGVCTCVCMYGFMCVYACCSSRVGCIRAFGDQSTTLALIPQPPSTFICDYVSHWPVTHQQVAWLENDSQHSGPIPVCLCLLTTCTTRAYLHTGIFSVCGFRRFNSGSYNRKTNTSID